MIFCDKKFFLRKKYFDVPHAIGVLGRTFVEPITPGLSQRGRLLGAVAQWQLRLCFYIVRIYSLYQFTMPFILLGFEKKNNYYVGIRITFRLRIWMQVKLSAYE